MMAFIALCAGWDLAMAFAEVMRGHISSAIFDTFFGVLLMCILALITVCDRKSA